MKRAQQYIATLTSKGQVTIPIEVRRALNLQAQDKLIFRLVEGKVEVEPLPMTLEDAYGSVPPLSSPEDFETMRAAVREERVARTTRKLDS